MFVICTHVFICIYNYLRVYTISVMACERALGPEPEAEFGHFFLSLNRVRVSSCYCSLILEESSIGKSFFSKNNVLIIA